jgi:hypothetical protein
MGKSVEPFGEDRDRKCLEADQEFDAETPAAGKERPAEGRDTG